MYNNYILVIIVNSYCIPKATAMDIMQTDSSPWLIYIFLFC